MNKDWTKVLPPMLSGEELQKAMAFYPVYNPAVREKNAAERLIALSSLYDLYLPNSMSAEIYTKLYLATLRSLQKKQTKLSTLQLIENCKMIVCVDFSSWSVTLLLCERIETIKNNIDW